MAVITCKVTEMKMEPDHLHKRQDVYSLRFHLLASPMRLLVDFNDTRAELNPHADLFSTFSKHPLKIRPINLPVPVPKRSASQQSDSIKPLNVRRSVNLFRFWILILFSHNLSRAVSSRKRLFGSKRDFLKCWTQTPEGEKPGSIGRYLNARPVLGQSVVSFENVDAMALSRQADRSRKPSQAGPDNDDVHCKKCWGLVFVLLPYEKINHSCGSSFVTNGCLSR